MKPRSTYFSVGWQFWGWLCSPERLGMGGEGAKPGWAVWLRCHLVPLLLPGAVAASPGVAAVLEKGWEVLLFPSPAALTSLGPGFGAASGLGDCGDAEIPLLEPLWERCSSAPLPACPQPLALSGKGCWSTAGMRWECPQGDSWWHWRGAPGAASPLLSPTRSRVLQTPDQL